MKGWIKRKGVCWMVKATLVLLGGGAGYLYHALIGCSTGGCVIAASPWLSVLLGALLGLGLATARPDAGKTDAPGHEWRDEWES